MSHPASPPRRVRRLVPWCALLVLAACGEETPARPGFVAVSVPPLGALVTMIAGPEIPVEVFLPGNQSAHDFEPTPGDAARLAGARLVVCVDPRLDPWMERAARAVAGEEATVITQGAGEGRDPHAWLDPPGVIAFVPELAEALAAAFPDRAAAIRERAGAAAARLTQADAACAQALAPVASAPFVLQLPAFVNFAARHELRLLAVIQSCPEEEPTPGAFARAATAMRETGGRVVFAHRGVARAPADALALEVGGRVVVLDPFGAGDGDLAALWTANAALLAEALAHVRD